MPKYKVKHTSIMHNKHVYGEGSTIELDEKQAKRIADFVELIPEKVQASNTKTQTQTSTAKSTKAKTETKTTKNETKTETETEKTNTETKDGEGSDGGQK